ncbi:hypothetical protein QP585_14560 [Serratia ureilytica]|uniref:hypothetical protein n=1 Tax=Serratia TaxID=613 RepID=UPI00114E79CC|nr:hypothetical protein [Serratia ureilytica]MDK7594333.1 hypothetical protein [Serratia ureilytica]QDI12547.1 hypothetical protein FBF84_04965 [Serratia marcescens]QDI22290.1 hypothetical protein FBF90_04965 [Serratia marcescens]HEM7577665.1 hypothetical protein [Serratia marcescens]
MLKGYFKSDDARVSDEQNKKIIAMSAALEIAKASAAAQTANSRTDKVENDLKYAAQEIETLAKAIRAFMDS